MEKSSTAPRLAPTAGVLSRLPWWALIALAAAAYYIFVIITQDNTNKAFWFVFGQRQEELSAGTIVFKGMILTVVIGIIAYAMALTIGVIMGLGRVSKNSFYYNFSTLYVEVIRGTPILVLLLYIAFVAVPLGVDGINWLGEQLVNRGMEFAAGLADFKARDFSNTARATIGLAMAYGAFSAETVRAGIESIDKGQMEAAKALGMTYGQSMRHIILPQVFRRVLPIFGNDFVAMIKDSSLVSVLGVADMTYQARLFAASSFLFFQTYTVLAFLYLVATIMLTRIVRWLERKLAPVGTLRDS